MKQSQRITVAERAFESNLTDLMKRPNVVGAEIGYRERGGKATDEVVVQVLVERKMPSEELSPKELLPAELAVEDHDGPVGVDVVEVGRIELPISTDVPDRPRHGALPAAAGRRQRLAHLDQLQDRHARRLGGGHHGQQSRGDQRETRPGRDDEQQGPPAGQGVRRVLDGQRDGPGQAAG